MQYIVHLSQQITRRKRIHWLQTDQAEVLCVTRDAKQIWEYLYDHEIRAVVIDLPEGSLEVTIGQLLPWPV